jgi:hypothetical protein
MTRNVWSSPESRRARRNHGAAPANPQPPDRRGNPPGRKLSDNKIDPVENMALAAADFVAGPD